MLARPWRLVSASYPFLSRESEARWRSTSGEEGAVVPPRCLGRFRVSPGSPGPSPQPGAPEGRGSAHRPGRGSLSSLQLPGGGDFGFRRLNGKIQRA